MFKWMFRRFRKKEKVKERKKEDSKGIILVMAGNLRQFQKWCNLNSFDFTQQYARNIINDINLRGLTVQMVDNIIFTGTFWENKMIMSPYFRNFFREWELNNEKNKSK